MGLGHATRSLPLIRELLARGCEVTVGSSGRSLIFLRQEVPDAGFVDLPDYRLTYSHRGVTLPGMLVQVPHMLKMIRREHRLTAEFVRQQQIDLVISDHRYGCYSESVPSFFITHQLRFIAPFALRPFEFIGVRFNRRYHQKYTGVIIPDLRENAGGLFSGRLSQVRHRANYYFPGILSSVGKQNKPSQDIDLLVSISGPEPQRSVFEEIVRRQIGEVPGQKVVVLGKPEAREAETPVPGLTIYPHLSRRRMEEFLSRSKLVVSRSGYSTVMELAELGKKALFVPTPGQTEQNYLAQRFASRDWAMGVPQKNVNLSRDIRLARNYSGFPGNLSTAQTVDTVMRLLFEP